jgi:hypothetical protein
MSCHMPVTWPLTCAPHALQIIPWLTTWCPGFHMSPHMGVTWPDTCAPHVLQIIPWLNYSVPGVLNLGILTVNTCLAFYSFLGCVVADPGSVPFDYVPESEITPPVVEVKRKVRESRAPCTTITTIVVFVPEFDAPVVEIRWNLRDLGTTPISVFVPGINSPVVKVKRRVCSFSGPRRQYVV